MERKLAVGDFLGEYGKLSRCWTFPKVAGQLGFPLGYATGIFILVGGKDRVVQVF